MPICESTCPTVRVLGTGALYQPTGCGLDYLAHPSPVS